MPAASTTPILHITVTGIPAVKKHLGGALPQQTLVEAAGRGVSNRIISHLRRRNNRPSKPGWPKSNYWEDAASSTQTHIRGSAAIVSIHAPGIRLHLKGGTVNAKPGKALAIPARPEVAGIWPSEYSGSGRVFLLVRKAFGKAWLAEQEPSGHLRILWRLLKKTEHTADPTVLPSRSALSQAANDAVRSILPHETT